MFERHQGREEKQPVLREASNEIRLNANILSRLGSVEAHMPATERPGFREIRLNDAVKPVVDRVHREARTIIENEHQVRAIPLFVLKTFHLLIRTLRKMLFGATALFGVSFLAGFVTALLSGISSYLSLGAGVQTVLAVIGHIVGFGVGIGLVASVFILPLVLASVAIALDVLIGLFRFSERELQKGLEKHHPTNSKKIKIGR